MAQDRTDTVFENKFYDTKFYFDWNSGSQSKSKYGNVWPGLIFTETEAGLHSRLDPYIRGDVEDDTDDEESNSDFDFNDLQDGKRETYLNTFQCSYNKNKKPVTLIKVNAPNLYKDDYDQLCSVIQLSNAVIAGSVNADYSNIKTSDNVPQKLLIELKKDSEFANSFIYYNGKPVYGMTPDGIIAMVIILLELKTLNMTALKIKNLYMQKFLVLSTGYIRRTIIQDFITLLCGAITFTYTFLLEKVAEIQK